MALHEKLTRILRRLPSLPLEPELSALSVADIRKALNLGTSADPLPLARVETVELPLPGRTLRARVYARSETANLPVALYLHGGGYVLGTLDTHDHICRRLAADGEFAVVSLEYRLAPESPFPAAVLDAYESACFLNAYGHTLGLDGSRLAVIGDSAGGGLAAATCLVAKERGGPQIKHQVLVYPVTDALGQGASYEMYGRGMMLTSDLMFWMLRQYVSAEHREHPWVSPLRAPSLRGLPAATIITAEYDVLRDDGLAYAARLSEANVPVTTRHHDDMVHGFWAMWLPIDVARASILFAAQQLEAALRA